MARGSITCDPHVYLRIEWAILHPFRKHSPEGVARAMWRTSGSPYYSISRPQKDERLSWPCWLTYSGRFIHISGHTSATGRAWDRGSSLVKDRRSTTVQSGQRTRASKQATFHNLVAKYVYLCKNRKLHCELRYTRFWWRLFAHGKWKERGS